MKTALAAVMLATLASFFAISDASTASAAAPAAIANAGAPAAALAPQVPPIPLASNLQRDSRHAARTGMPLVLFFSLPDCRYCHTVRHNYLAPMLHSAYTIREIEVGGGVAATGLEGAATSHAALARQFGVRFAPTVLFVGPNGAELAPPLKGGDTAGMYGAYLDARLATARQAISATSPPERTAP